jgi:hypothetical protein
MVLCVVLQGHRNHKFPHPTQFNLKEKGSLILANIGTHL